jgi:hypothetical protein
VRDVILYVQSYIPGNEKIGISDAFPGDILRKLLALKAIGLSPVDLRPRQIAPVVIDIVIKRYWGRAYLLAALILPDSKSGVYAALLPFTKSTPDKANKDTTSPIQFTVLNSNECNPLIRIRAAMNRDAQQRLPLHLFESATI